MAASSSTVHGRTASKPRSLLAECAGMDARAPRPRGCPFFGYFLWASKESDSAARMADETTHGREPVFAKRLTSRKKIKMDSGFRRNDGVRAFAENDGTEAFAGMTKKNGRPKPPVLIARETRQSLCLNRQIHLERLLIFSGIRRRSELIPEP